MTRLPAHLEVSGLIRLVESQGGTAMVLAKGERDVGTILIVTMCRGEDVRLFERMPQMDGTRPFLATKSQDLEKQEEFSEYLDRRRRQDPDIWIVEVDIANAERFVELLPR
jgi:hypothetical protein